MTPLANISANTLKVTLTAGDSISFENVGLYVLYSSQAALGNASLLTGIDFADNGSTARSNNQGSLPAFILTPARAVAYSTALSGTTAPHLVTVTALES